MPAVIQRVVSKPPRAWTEYLLSEPGEPEAWGEKKYAHRFKTHAIADQFAGILKEAARLHNEAVGRIEFAFVHARTLENDEWDDFTKEPPPASLKVKMDPRRMAEVLRDPVEAWS